MWCATYRKGLQRPSRCAGSKLRLVSSSFGINNTQEPRLRWLDKALLLNLCYVERRHSEWEGRMWCERGRRGLGPWQNFEEATGNWDLLYFIGGSSPMKHLLTLHRNDWTAIYLESRPTRTRASSLYACISAKAQKRCPSKPYSSATRTRGSSIGFNMRIPLIHNLWATNTGWWGGALCKFREGSYWVARLSRHNGRQRKMTWL